MDNSELISRLDVKEFVEQRVAQVADLLQVVDNPKLVAGEVTKGPRTAAQRLPRHMRRRAMAYEVRRFPKGLRTFAKPFIISNHRKKAPSRFYRRRPRNLLLNYIRRQKRAVWMETHIWHAKRFHMIERWGYRIPDRSFQRNFRPVFRASMRSCTIRDKSYLSCFQICGKSQEQLIGLLKPLCEPSASPTFAFKSGLTGCYEVNTLLYQPSKYPQGFICPARFLWHRVKDRPALAVWVHPSCREQVLEHLVQLLAVTKVDTEFETPEKVPSSEEEWRIQRIKTETQIYRNEDEEIEIRDLRDQLNRFRLCGPLSLVVLRKALLLADSEDNVQQHEVWKAVNRLSPGQIADGRVFSLLAEDPRLSWAAGKVNSDDLRDVPNEALSLIQPSSSFWDSEERLNSLDKRLTDGELNAKRSNSVGTVSTTPCKVPLLVIIRNSGRGKASALDGVDLIAPSGFGSDLWVALQMKSARASGLRDELAAHFESNSFAFPTDCPDASAGIVEEKRILKAFELKHEKRPHNRRVNYWKDKSILYPFSFEFSQLIKEIGDADSPFVLRDRRELATLDDFLKGKLRGPIKMNEFWEKYYSSMLVPVEIKCPGRGTPKKFALICRPTQEDIRAIKSGKFILREPKRDEKNEEESRMDAEENHDKSPSPVSTKTTWKEYVSLDPATNVPPERPISLKELFPETRVVDKAQKRKLLNRAKKEKAKKRKLERSDKMLARNTELEEMRKMKYRFAATRETIGRVVRGDFSFTSGSGSALALIPFSSLCSINNSPMVLFRNITSQNYHTAKISICTSRLEI